MMLWVQPVTMSQGRDNHGRFTETVSDQQILKTFDYADDPVLTARDVAEGLQRFGADLTPEAVTQRLKRMQGEGLVDRKKLGARAVGWWAEVAPKLSDETATRVDERKDSDEWEEL